MKDCEMEERLRAFDFSLCHPVREKLLSQLLNMHRMERGEVSKVTSCRVTGSLENERLSPWTAGKLSMDELDWATAAGTLERERKPDEDGV